MPESDRTGGGSLIVVGTGIRIVGQLTVEAIAWMRRADRLLYVVADRLAVEALHELNPGGAESLSVFYAEGEPRPAAYRAMVDRILQCVRSGLTTCVASYGHPGVFGDPFHEAVRRARAEGYPARMLPAISAMDCLFADLGIDPATDGCQSYDATDFLKNRRTLDPAAAAILWQVGQVGDPIARGGRPEPWALPLLAGRLCGFHPPDHVCYLYQAAVVPGAEPDIATSTLRDLPRAALAAMSTLYIPPSAAPSADPMIVDRMRAMVAGAGAAQAGAWEGSTLRIDDDPHLVTSPRG